jgi:ABC-2 type transport system ATP-binding protein
MIMNRIEKFWNDGSEYAFRPAVIEGELALPDRRFSPQAPTYPVSTNRAFATEGPAAEPNCEFKPAIVLENLTKKFKSHYAVDDVSFYVPKGSTLGLLGGNGAGKTTTIAMIMGLVIPSYGSVSVLGHDMTTARHKVLKRMNFQSPYVAMPAQLTVLENLNVFARLYGVPDFKTRIGEVVEEFGLGEVLNGETGRLSAGQKTRVSLAKALLNKPEVLLLDEPTASLDPDRAEWMRSRLQAYQEKHQATILLSSHNMIEVEQLCDYVVIMSRGRVAEIGTPEELIQRYECSGLQEVFLQITRSSEAWQPEMGSDTPAPSSAQAVRLDP